MRLVEYFANNEPRLGAVENGLVIDVGGLKPGLFVDWELELAVVMGTGGKNIPLHRALEHVFGYTIINDVSEIPDPQVLQLGLEVNGEVMQNSTTAKMIFSVAQLISYFSEYVTLEPGDILATGTPEGIGLSRGRFLRPGDVVRSWISGLGCLENPVTALTS